MLQHFKLPDTLNSPLQKLLRLTKPIFAGCGSIWMFHRITDPPPHRRIGWCEYIENTPHTLRTLVELARAQGYIFVSIGELCERLKRGQSEPKCIVITFDDGYRDVYENAYPFLRREGIPFTVYIATGYADRTCIPWWYLLETGIATSKLNSPGDHHLSTADKFNHFAKQFDLVSRSEQIALAERLFGAEFTAKTRELFLTWEQIQSLSQDPLVTLGAHTVSHPNLKELNTDTALAEMRESRRILSERLGRRIDHFAYPLGSREHAGPREFALAQKAGFQSAVTTRIANVFPQHIGHMHALPRIYGRSAAEFLLGMAGLRTLSQYRKRFVFDQ